MRNILYLLAVTLLFSCSPRPYTPKDLSGQYYSYYHDLLLNEDSTCVFSGFGSGRGKWWIEGKKVIFDYGDELKPKTFDSRIILSLCRGYPKWENDTAIIRNKNKLIYTSYDRLNNRKKTLIFKKQRTNIFSIFKRNDDD